MKRYLIAIGAIALLGAAGLGMAGVAATTNAPDAAAQASAREQSATFAIENMTCATCPITVKKAMTKVNGVKSVEVNFEAKTAKVVFDPARTGPDEIARASTDAGYPARAI